MIFLNLKAVCKFYVFCKVPNGSVYKVFLLLIVVDSAFPVIPRGAGSAGTGVDEVRQGTRQPAGPAAALPDRPPEQGQLGGFIHGQTLG